MQTDKEIFRHPGSCIHCGSLNVKDKIRIKICQDCGCQYKPDGEIVKEGFLDIHYCLEAQNHNGRTLWMESLGMLFEAQCDVAAGLKINPGSSFAKWLNSFDTAGTGVLEQPELLETFHKVVFRILQHEKHVRNLENVERIRELLRVLPQSARLRITLRR